MVTGDESGRQARGRPASSANRAHGGPRRAHLEPRLGAYRHAEGGIVNQRFEGKVALITGAARGQGRAEAIGLAEEGADIIAIDVCDSIPTVTYEGTTPDDLKATVRAVEGLGRRIESFQ